MTPPAILAATWTDGLYIFTGETRHHELAGHAVQSLAHDHNGGVLAIIDSHSLHRRTRAGAWSTIATSELDLTCMTVVGDKIYAGTDDARLVRISRAGQITPLAGFDTAPGRDTWFAGGTMIDGQFVGPPLAIRSIAATADDAAVLVNVHVGGIPRSTNGGVTWQSTIDVASDVHEVCAHPVDPRTVIAASAVGLCVSHDGGASWTIERKGLHGLHCSAAAFSGNRILVSAATDHFAAQGAVYQRPIDSSGPLAPVTGLPRWLGGIVDTGCIATLGAALAIADKTGNLYASTDGGHSWRHRASGLPMVSKLLYHA